MKKKLPGREELREARASDLLVLFHMTIQLQIFGKLPPLEVPDDEAALQLLVLLGVISEADVPDAQQFFADLCDEIDARFAPERPR